MYSQLSLQINTSLYVQYRRRDVFMPLKKAIKSGNIPLVHVYKYRLVQNPGFVDESLHLHLANPTFPFY